MNESVQTMVVIDLTLEKDGDGWTVTDRSSEIVKSPIMRRIPT